MQKLLSRLYELAFELSTENQTWSSNSATVTYVHQVPALASAMDSPSTAETHHKRKRYVISRSVGLENRFLLLFFEQVTIPVIRS